MIQSRTIFILGAGASCPYGLPTGNYLRSKMRMRLNQEEAMFYNHGFDKPLIREFNRALALGERDTVDFFLAQDGNEKYRKIGKFAIAYEICTAEKQDTLMSVGSIDGGLYTHAPLSPEREKEWGSHWYRYLWNKMEHSLDKFDRNSQISFITFNYDRSLEEYLFTAFKHLNLPKNLNDLQIRSYIEKMKIVHVHGSVGKLPWQQLEAGEKAVKYGEGDMERIYEASDNIRIMHEVSEDDPRFIEARALLSEAKNADIFFLGFGFHPENLNRLGLYRENISDDPKNLYTTVRGINPNQLRRIEDRLNRSFVTGHECKDCRDLLEHYL